MNVLNELLMFDKLEGGTLMLEKTKANAMELITKTITPFQIQVCCHSAAHIDSG